jgi:NAD(P)-dependent dehydrogenase (short-subunit alcohol dehydrogenase family)
MQTLVTQSSQSRHAISAVISDCVDGTVQAMTRLTDKVCIVTGATSGIGRATAERFVTEGAQVVLVGRRDELGTKIAADLGARASFVRADVSQESDVISVIRRAHDRFGRIDCLFNNAGGPGQTGGIEGLDVDRFDATFANNVRSVMLGMKHVAPIMKAQGSGSIINNASVAGSRSGYSSSFVYGSSKAAVIQLTKVVALELAEHHVRVNSISPGAIATGIFGKVFGMADDAADATAAAMQGAFAAAQPVPRAGLPADIAGVAVFLASDDSAFVTAHDLVVDGGLIAGRPFTQAQNTYAMMRKAFGIED